MIKYDCRLAEDRLPMLVREDSFRYRGSRDIADSPQRVADFLSTKEDIDSLMEEQVFVICTDNKKKVIGYFSLSKGTQNTCTLDIRSLFIRVLATGAAGFIVAHNHPSGDVTPSASDIAMSDRVGQAADILGLTYDDFLIVGKPYGYGVTSFSFHAEGLIKKAA